MTETPKDQETELKDLKKELSRLRLEANLRKSLATQLEKQKKVAEDAKAEAQSKTQQMEDVSGQLAKYLSPQIYESIFSGKQNVEVKSYRKKITVFFSDIVNFTAISDKLESEELTALLNFYLNEMSQIALKHGATIDKYIGDAIMIFFGDPESFGIEEDARRCVAMAVEMQQRMAELWGYWSKHFGLKKDLEIRVGINTGYCTVGNFGSEDRLDYTVVGAAVNLASRLESAAMPSGILVSEETYFQVKDYFSFDAPQQLELKGLERGVIAYEVDISDTSRAETKNFEGENFQLKLTKHPLDLEELETLKKIIDELSEPQPEENVA
ncbi:adenylate/guanylate cyclase domain-containing protein [Paracoccaceae bacterium]|nr:adenylate/guanylate cyclase domain-containing protein [Paracoccaceae bacterium]OAH08153.1 Adenylate cyclase 2 [Rhodobacteraceae bacterium SB2]WQC64151.1 adenylate/guanylate cyclase domain-containing protein [Alphaproteobacteria bacterium US3C007]MBT7416301.1 adenylate/guanylate cyclase domain-containing protein [Paracoccaceae bacterium]MDA8542255.1 adenylate/guanylate cyclase domain-containing protein [Paracoccaceae bacterium]